MSIDPSTAPEVPAWVKDSTGNYYKIGGGGTAAPPVPEVYAQATEPTPTTSDMIWVDTSAPAASTVTEPHVKVAGDTMTGALYVPVPTLITQVGRWAEGVPRFATVAARDAAYTSIGGPVEGMTSYLADLDMYQGFKSGTGWLPVGGVTPAWGIWWGGGQSFTFPESGAIISGAPQNLGLHGGVTYDPGTGKITLPYPGVWNVTVSLSATNSAGAGCNLNVDVVGSAGSVLYAHQYSPGTAYVGSVQIPLAFNIRALAGETYHLFVASTLGGGGTMNTCHFSGTYLAWSP